MKDKKLIDINTAVKLLKDNEVVAIPTETVYGLAACIDRPSAIEKIFHLKQRPYFDPLIVHVSSIAMAKKYCRNWSSSHEILAKKFWPGPLTMILDKNELIDPTITSGLDSVGIRMPHHPLTQELIERLDTPLAAPSANIFKKTSPTKIIHILKDFEQAPYILDGGDSEVGIESTICQVFTDKILIYRPGKITASEIKKALEDSIEVEYAQSPVAPGQLNEHYRPNIPITLTSFDKIEEVKKALKAKNISQWDITNDPYKTARILYHQFRVLSHQSDHIIISIDPELIKKDEWQGVGNRLKKAASSIKF